MSAVSMIGASAATPATMKSAPALGQSDFLKLMTAQLTTQDPFNPVDNSQMVAQMAQFSQVAGIAEMNASLSAIAERLGGNGDVSGWIGRAMLVESPTLAALPDGSYRGEIETDGAATVDWTLVDADGVVRASGSGATSASGTMPVEWPGDGADHGPLRLIVSASDGGQPVSTASRAWTEILAVQSPSAGAAARLVTPLGMFAPDAAHRLS